jgi:hypothetical protein
MKRVKYIPVLLLALGCAPYLSEDGGRCPCKDNWRCCSDKCIPEQYLCTSEDGGNGVDGDRDTMEVEGCASDGDLAGSDRGCCVYDSDCPDEHLCIDGICVHNRGGDDGGTDDGGDHDAGDLGFPPGLLASCPSSEHGTGSPARDQIVFFLAYNTGGVGCMAWVGMETPHSGPGTTVFDAGSGAEFDDFVVCMTNGIDDYIDSGSQLYPPGSGSAGLYAESEFWNRSTDFAGCEIDRLRLIVSSLTLVPDGDGTRVDAEWIWQVWGDCGGGD